MRRLLLSLVGAALVAIVVTALPAGASPAERPFRGVVSGAVTFVPAPGCPVGLRTDSAAGGVALHLGATAMTSAHCSGSEFSGVMTFVAANGDMLFAHYENDGLSPIPVPGTEGQVYTVHVDFTIAGGTGRFEHAVGGGDITAYLVFEGYGDPSWPATWVWQGTIGY